MTDEQKPINNNILEKSVVSTEGEKKGLTTPFTPTISQPENTPSNQPESVPTAPAENQQGSTNKNG